MRHKHRSPGPKYPLYTSSPEQADEDFPVTISAADFWGVADLGLVYVTHHSTSHAMLQDGAQGAVCYTQNGRGLLFTHIRMDKMLSTILEPRAAIVGCT